LRVKLGNLGREYVLSRYQPEIVRRALIAAVESATDDADEDG
jgi:hypothetical protein